MRILITGGRNDYQLSTKIAGIANSTHVEEITLVRRKPLSGIDKVTNIVPKVGVAQNLLLFESWRTWKMKSLLHQGRVDVAISFHISNGVGMSVIAGRRDIPYVLCPMGNDIQQDLVRSWKTPFYRRLARKASAMVVLGPSSEEIAVKAGVSPDNIWHIPNVQDGDRFFPRDDPKRWDLVFVGRLHEVKRLDILIIGFAQALDDRPNLTLAIVGGGSERQRLEELTNELGVGNEISFLGYHPHPEDILHKSRAVILTSRSEGLPAAALEGMLCGLPAILTDVGDVRGVFSDRDNALLIPPNDISAVANAITKLFTEPQLIENLTQSANTARERYLAKASLDAVTDSWTQLLLKVTNKVASEELSG